MLFKAIIIIVLSSGIASGQVADKKKYTFGFSERFRLTSWDNAINLDDNTQDDGFAFTRMRTNFSFNWYVNGSYEIGLKLTNENRVWLSPKSREFNWNELFINNLYIKWKKVGQIPMNLILGRQDIVFGEGFLVKESQPLCGSRSRYFDAARADYELRKGHNLSAWIGYIPDVGDVLPIMNEQHQAFNEQGFRGMGLYYNGSLRSIHTEAYYLRKDTRANERYPIESVANVAGSRMIVPFNANFSLTAEGAYQFGSYGVHDQSALGGYFHLDWLSGGRIPFLHTGTLGGVYLTGDDPETDVVESWDPMWSRWVKWANSYFYTLKRERGLGYWSNMSSFYVTLSSVISDQVNFSCTMYKLWADENETPAASFVGLAGTGKNRGNLLVTRLNIKMNKYMTGYILWEMFNPGDYYISDADNYNWIRIELMIKM